MIVVSSVTQASAVTISRVGRPAGGAENRGQRHRELHAGVDLAEDAWAGRATGRRRTRYSTAPLPISTSRATATAVSHQGSRFIQVAVRNNATSSSLSASGSRILPRCEVPVEPLREPAVEPVRHRAHRDQHERRPVIARMQRIDGRPDERDADQADEIGQVPQHRGAQGR